MRFAALADIHGNSFALEAVLQDMDSLGIKDAVNLGDFFSGPLDAAKIATMRSEERRVGKECRSRWSPYH